MKRPDVIEANAEVYKTRESWLKARRRGIGASEGAAVLGLHPYKSALEVFVDKTAEDVEELVPNMYMRAGTILEPAICDWYGDDTDRLLIDTGDFTIYRHPDYPHICATPDRLITPNGKPMGVLEAKNVSFGASASWKEGVPIHHRLQLQQQMGVLGLEWGSIVGLLGGNDLVFEDFDSDLSVWTEMIRALGEFWERVQNNDPPVADGSESSVRALERLYPKTKGSTVMLPEEIDEVDFELQEIKEAAKPYKKGGKAYTRQKELEGQIKSAIGASEVGLLSSGVSYSYKWQDRAEHMVKAGRYRGLRRRKK